VLVTFSAGFDPTDAGNPTSMQVGYAVIDVTQSGGPVSPHLIASPAYPAAASAAAATPGTGWISTWTGAQPGDPNGDELWVGAVASDAAISASATSLPRLAAHRAGDQRHPALASTALTPGGALVSAWEDYGSGVSSGAAVPDVVLEVVPLPSTRLPAMP
jgi:hypothetical protein